MFAGRAAAAAAGCGCGFGECSREEDADNGGGMTIWNFIFVMGYEGRVGLERRCREGGRGFS